MLVPKYNDAIVWLNLFDCLNTMFSQHKLAHWSALQRLSEPTRSKTASKYMLAFKFAYENGSQTWRRDKREGYAYFPH